MPRTKKKTRADQEIDDLIEAEYLDAVMDQPTALDAVLEEMDYRDDLPGLLMDLEEEYEDEDED